VAKPNESSEIVLTRVYDAPVKAVWDAWTDPAQVAKWWGPRGFTLTTHRKDLRVGGHWAYTMHGPDGTDYENEATYHKVEEYSRLVYDHGVSDDRPPLFRVTATFEDLGGKTRLQMRMVFATVEVAKESRKFIKKAGGESTWDRLGEYLAETRAGKNTFVINRTFDAPIARVFEAWTKPEQVVRWLPPTGFDMRYVTADLRAGGECSFVMTKGAVTLNVRTRYLELQPPERLAYEQQFVDEEGRVARHPGLPVWPEAILNTVTFAAEAEDRTRVTVESEPFGPASEAELEAFRKTRADMAQGWTGSFDQLEKLVERE
jgi:uncharacterized protein YndB with AHSA1/START domain